MANLTSNPIFLSYRHEASILKNMYGVDYETTDINFMANEYCKAKDEGNEDMKNYYISALMLRFWYQAGKLQAKSPNLRLSFDDYVSWLYEAIEYACKYRAWQNPEKHCNAQQAINQCINTIRLQHYFSMNMNKSKINQTTCSLDDYIDEDGKASKLDTLEDSSANDYLRNIDSDMEVKGIVQRYLDNNKIIEGIILNTIAFNDCERVIKVDKGVDERGKKITSEVSEFYPKKLVNNLSNLPNSFVSTFSSAYNIPKSKVESAYQAITKANNAKLYRMVKKTLDDARINVKA